MTRASLFLWQTAGCAMGSIRSRADNHKLFMDFRFDGQRCREQTALDDTPANRKKLEKVLQRIEHGTFDYARFFPNSKMARKFGGASAGGLSAKSSWTIPPFARSRSRGPRRSAST